MGKLRNVNQQFDAAKPMVWRRSILFAGERTVVGERVPDFVLPSKLRSLWMMDWIELAPQDGGTFTPKAPATAAEPAPCPAGARDAGRPASRRDRRRARTAR